jgi:hypothetical protein
LTAAARKRNKKRKSCLAPYSVFESTALLWCCAQTVDKPQKAGLPTVFFVLK